MMLLSCQWHWEQDKAIGSLLPVMVHHILFVVAPIFLSLFFINKLRMAQMTNPDECCTLASATSDQSNS